MTADEKMAITCFGKINIFSRFHGSESPHHSSYDHVIKRHLIDDYSTT